MSSLFSKSAAPLLCAALAVPAWASLSAQPQPQPADASSITVTGSVPADLTGLVEGPEIEGLISARSGEHMQVLGADGSRTMILVSEATDIKARGGFLGLSRTRLPQDALLNGLPVPVQTVPRTDGPVDSQTRRKKAELETTPRR